MTKTKIHFNLDVYDRKTLGHRERADFVVEQPNIGSAINHVLKTLQESFAGLECDDIGDAYLIVKSESNIFTFTATVQKEKGLESGLLTVAKFLAND